MFRPKSTRLFPLAAALLVAITSNDAEAGGWFRRRAARPAAAPASTTPVVAPVPAAPIPTAAVRPTGGTLGTFEPTPYVMVRGSGFTGGGYSPLDMYGDATMSLYGPISSFRTTSAPVLNYARGYDGSARVVEGTSFSTPILPRLSPVVYPTQATYYYGFRETGNPPWWPSAINWVDQN